MSNLLNDYPDAKKHQLISFIKSGIRLGGYLLLFGINSPWAIAAGVILIFSEIVGIFEELV